MGWDGMGWGRLGWGRLKWDRMEWDSTGRGGRAMVRPGSITILGVSLQLEASSRGLVAVTLIMRLSPAALARLGLSVLRVAPAEHCPDAWAVAVRRGVCEDAGFSVLYSGDTRPCDAIVKLGEQESTRREMRDAYHYSCNAQPTLPTPRFPVRQVKSPRLVLVHEATFDDSESMQLEAVQRK